MIRGILRAGAMAILLLNGCGGGGGGSGAASTDKGSQTADRALQGGDTTISNRDTTSFSTTAANLTAEEDAQHDRGDENFAHVFTVAEGLGPVFNHTSCQGCHLADGRGRADIGGRVSEALIRFSTADGTPDVPGIGGQGQDHSIAGYSPEIDAKVSYSEVGGRYADGTPYSLRQPNLTIHYGDGKNLPAGTLTSFRIAPVVFGLGLLDEVRESEILSYADPDDGDGDGISGRPNYPTDRTTGAPKLGRFGWKSNTPTVRQQCAGAYQNDMGVTNPLFPDGNLDTNPTTNIDEATLSDTVFYVKTLGVPTAANVDDPTVKHGEELFKSANCVGCHVQTLHTGSSSIAALSDQTIHPYTDLLLHDLGAGLADNRPDVLASGSEWRTTPLWGIGLTGVVASGTTYLHDGRARSLEEAILWHGGEAESAKNAFTQMSKVDRDALIAFLSSL